MNGAIIAIIQVPAQAIQTAGKKILSLHVLMQQGAHGGNAMKKGAGHIILLKAAELEKTLGMEKTAHGKTTGAVLTDAGNTTQMKHTA